MGAEVKIELVSVEGSRGGEFGFWEQGSSEPTVSIAAGERGNQRWHLSENAGVVGSDPFGHVHGRWFTVTMPGSYTVTFRLHDDSINRPDGGAIHHPSEPLEIRFIAGDGISIVVRDEGDYLLAFEVLIAYFVQASV